jgi:K+-transporting ATPase A subunit
MPHTSERTYGREPYEAPLLTGVIVIAGAFTFLLALILGPVAEHFATQAGLPF